MSIRQGSIGYAGYRIRGIKLLDPSGAWIAAIHEMHDGRDPNHQVYPLAPEIKGLGVQTKREHGSVGAACQFLARHHCEALQAADY